MSNPRHQAEQIIERYDAETQDILRHTRIDLDAFLALKGEARSARWRMWDATAKADAVIQQLTRNGEEWTDAKVAAYVAKYDAKYGQAPASDLAIPSAAQIADAAAEQAATARQHADHKGAGQLDRVRLNVLQGARLAWHGGELLIASLNTPGAVYAVSRAGCSCPNGRAGKSTCWHVALHDLLLDMLAQRADEADEAAEADAETEPPPTSPAELGQRLADARRAFLAAA